MGGKSLQSQVEALFDQDTVRELTYCALTRLLYRTFRKHYQNYEYGVLPDGKIDIDTLD